MIFFGIKQTTTKKKCLHRVYDMQESKSSVGCQLLSIVGNLFFYVESNRFIYKCPGPNVWVLIKIFAFLNTNPEIMKEK